MRMKRAQLSVCGLTTIVVATIVGFPAVAQEMRVRDLAQLCRVDQGRCRSRILGEVDGVNEGVRLSHGRALFCLPMHAGPGEKEAVVRKYMHDHPETLSVDVGGMVAGALADAYPCPPHKR